MIDKQDFAKTELNDHIKNIVYRNIIEGLMKERVSSEIVLNRYSVTMNFVDEQVTIIDDVFSEEEELQLSLREFFTIIRASQAVKDSQSGTTRAS